MTPVLLGGFGNDGKHGKWRTTGPGEIGAKEAVRGKHGAMKVTRGASPTAKANPRERP